MSTITCLFCSTKTPAARAYVVNRATCADLEMCAQCVRYVTEELPGMTEAERALDLQRSVAEHDSLPPIYTLRGDPRAARSRHLHWRIVLLKTYPFHTVATVEQFYAEIHARSTDLSRVRYAPDELDDAATDYIASGLASDLDAFTQIAATIQPESLRISHARIAASASHVPVMPEAQRVARVTTLHDAMACTADRDTSEENQCDTDPAEDAINAALGYITSGDEADLFRAELALATMTHQQRHDYTVNMPTIATFLAGLGRIPEQAERIEHLRDLALSLGTICPAGRPMCGC
jgi:hypothetical protein